MITHLGLRSTSMSMMRKGALTRLLALRSFSSSTQLLQGKPLVDIKTQTEMQDNLAKLRKQRPNSPHLQIYAPQWTWYPSGLNRLTGVALGGGLYAFAIAYLASPLLGVSLTSAAIASKFGALPFAVQALSKTIVALPFSYHSINSLRHLFWDTGHGLKVRQVELSSKIVVALASIVAVALAFL